MLRLNVLLAVRSLLKNKTTSFINIAGLTIAFSALVLILLFLVNEYSYDRYHDNLDRIYRVSRESLDANGNVQLHFGAVNFGLAEYAQKDFPQIIEKAVRISTFSNVLMTHEGNSIVEPFVAFADPTVFDVFSWKLVKGNRQNCLADLNSVVISESAAKRYFGDNDPIGKVLTMFRTQPLKVTGVMKDIPANSHYKTHVIVSMATRIQLDGGYENLMANQSNNDATYLLLQPDARIENLQQTLPIALDKYYQTTSDGRKMSDTYRYHYWPLKDLHLYFSFDSRTEPNGNYVLVFIFAATAFLILIIACINFINLSTAKLTQRSKEVGIKKTMGAFRTTLIGQFITEVFVFIIISLALAIGAAYVALPSFNLLIGKFLTIGLLLNPITLTGLVVVVITVSLIAGGYPAFYLSSFRASEVIKKGAHVSWRKFGIRHVLVGFQFFLALALIVSLFVMRQQLQFVQNFDVGFNKNNILVLPSSRSIFEKFEMIKNQLEQYPGIQKVSLSSLTPSRILADAQDPYIQKNGEMVALDLRIADVHIDHDFFKVLDVPIVAGRDFDYSLSTDSTQSFVINEEAVRQIGWSSNQEAVGQPFQYGQRKGTIIGVVKDFNFESLREPFKPVIFLITRGRSRDVIVSVDSSKESEVLKYLDDQWQALRPDFPFTYARLATNLEMQYTAENKIAQGALYFAVFAIIVSSLGVFGLALFMTEQRAKEMAIRKALGAELLSISLLMSRWFFVLMVIAALIAFPASYWLSKWWLSNFAFSTTIGLAPFIYSGVIVSVCIALSLVTQVSKTATQNIGEVLKNE